MPANGMWIQNIIHGCDTVMSHVTHLYHLSALDFINTSNFPGMAPWLPSYTASDMLDGNGAGLPLVLNYVTALKIRRKLHTAGALFSGRQPIQNAMVPGGVTTLFSSTMPTLSSAGTTDKFGPYNSTETVSKFKSLMMEVRTFINQHYIPDVITVATNFSSYCTQGVGCMKLLAYGDFPVNSSGKLAIKRGLVSALVPSTFDQANVKEYVDNSYYDYGVLDDKALHPFDGKTTPNMAGGYSWLKAPRYMSGTTPTVYEVGPLARMVVSYANDDPSVTANDSDTPSAGGFSLSNIRVGGTYTVKGLIDTALGAISVGATSLYSALGRHAARALEAKFLADAMAHNTAGWINLISPNASCYTYKKIPKTVTTGYGLCEAPRGALGHWIKIEGKKVAKYQCVVPSTWNFSPKDGTGVSGPVEQSLINSVIGTDSTSQVINILRIVHPFDCCIACAVHVVNPEGKETLKFAIGPDGRPTNVEVKE